MGIEQAVGKKTLQILVVEDELDSQEVVRGLLQFHGMDCQVAGTAEEALRVLESMTPQAIIVDLSLPAMDGWGFLRTLKRDRRLDRVPCVAVTAYHSVEVAQKAIEAGFDAYFAKPIDIGSFVGDLQRVVDA